MNSLNLLVLRCRDIERTKSFYARFGMSFSKHAHGKGPEHYAAEDEQGALELYPINPGETPDSAGLGFLVADLQSVSEALQDAGFAPGEIKDQPWGRTFVVRDPDGRRVEVKQAPGSPAY